MECRNRLFTMDHCSPYGAWPADFASWSAFKNCLYKSPKGTTAMDAKIVMDVGKQIITVGLPQCWDMHPSVGERIIISRSHPALDSITSGIVTDTIRLSLTMEWKLHWGHFEKFASDKHPMDKRCPAATESTWKLRRSAPHECHRPCTLSRPFAERGTTTST